MASVKTKKHTDIKHDSWVIQYCPTFLRDYAYLMRLDRPIGIWLLLLPSWWAIVMSAGGIFNMNLNDWKTFGLFAIGAVIMRGAGCIINDIWDRNLDKKVERTKLRPIAAGTISMTQALLFLTLLLFCGLMILFQMSFITILLGFLSFPLIVIYPFMKRITWWPQAVLGVVFNFGVLMGWAAVTAIIEGPALILYAACVLWTLGYDTIYAHQDKEDDALIGIKSTARKFGKNSYYWVAGFYSCAAILLLTSSYMALNSFIAPMAVLPAIGYGAYILQKWDVKKPDSALATFKANRDIGLLVLIGLCLSAI